MKPVEPEGRRGIERKIAAIARRQYGVVTRSQLLAAGVPPDVVDRLLRAERLRPVHRGVYLAGPIMAKLTREMAALLACGAGAVVSHRSAASVWELLPAASAPDIVEVTIRSGNRRRPRITIHRIRTLRTEETTTLHSIAITTPARTLLDLAGSAGSRELERALAEAFARRLTDIETLRSLLAHHAGRSGSRRLLAVIDAGQPALTRSEAEERFLKLIRRARLDRPDVNTRVVNCEVDFLWRAERLVVEIDGWAFHRSPTAFERDRQRDATLIAAGLRVMRVTWRQLVDEPEAVLVRLARSMGSAETVRVPPGH